MFSKGSGCKKPGTPTPQYQQTFPPLHGLGATLWKLTQRMRATRRRAPLHAKIEVRQTPLATVADYHVAPSCMSKKSPHQRSFQAKDDWVQSRPLRFIQ